MAYDEELADRIRAALGSQPVVEKRMFGGLAFLVGGHMAVAASTQGGLLVRVAAEDTDALVDRPGAREFEMGGRGPMKGWLQIGPEVLHDDGVLSEWVQRGVTFALTLPPK